MFYKTPDAGLEAQGKTLAEDALRRTRQEKVPTKPEHTPPEPEKLSSEIAAQRIAQLESVRKPINEFAISLRMKMPDPGFPTVEDPHFEDNLKAAQIRAELAIAVQIENFGHQLAGDKDMNDLIMQYGNSKREAKQPTSTPSLRELPTKLFRQLGVLFSGTAQKATENSDAIGEQIVALLNKKLNQAGLKGAYRANTLDDAEQILGISFK